MRFRRLGYQARVIVRRNAVVLLLISLVVVVWQVLPALLPDNKFEGPKTRVKDHWEKFVMYNSTAQTALRDLREFVHENHVELPLFSLKSKPRICVGVETARREGSPFKYLSQALASLVTRMSTKRGVYIHVFNVDDEPHLHTEVDEISDLFPVSNVKAKSPPNTVRKLQEGLDFADLFYEMRSWDCPHVVLVEDDALAQQGWVERVELAANQLRNRDWLMVRLYVVRKHYPAHTPVGVTDFDQGFNTVALMVRKEYLVPMADEVRAAINRVFATDDRRYFGAKDEFMSEHLNSFFRQPILGFEPPIFQHTGVFSSVMSRDKELLEYYMQAPNFESENQPIVFDAHQFHELLNEKP